MEKQQLQQFISKNFEYLLNSKKIQYNNKLLKTDYIINIINEFILKYYFNNNDKIEDEIKFNIWSTLLKKKYGMNYNYYINYLLDKEFIFLISNYYKNKKAKTYKLNINNLENIVKCKITDPILIKKHTKEYLNKSFTEVNNSSIELWIRKRLVDDLYKVNINYHLVKNNLENEFKNENINSIKYQKNLISIESINSGNLFFKFDDYGRLHTNFTILKKDIRNNYLTIEGDKLLEIDIRNSQPLFLALFLKKEINREVISSNKEFKLYFDLVKNGIFYDYIMDKYKELDRNEVKILTYKVFFGRNIDSVKENSIFKDLFPTIYNYLKEFKQLNNNYKTLSHELQQLESNFIFNTAIKRIYNENEYIKLITIHDSILFKRIDKDFIEKIFNEEMNKLYFKLNI